MGLIAVGLIVEFLVMTLQLKRSTREAAYNSRKWKFVFPEVSIFGFAYHLFTYNV